MAVPRTRRSGKAQRWSHRQRADDHASCHAALTPLSKVMTPMPTINATTLIVTEPSAVAARLAEAFGWEVTQDYGPFAELSAGEGALIWLNVPSGITSHTQQGTLVHYQVEDVATAVEHARAAGASILREPTHMDFGVESGWAQVDGGPIVDLYRPL